MKYWIHLIVSAAIVFPTTWGRGPTDAAHASEPGKCAASRARDVFLSGYLPVEGAKPVSGAAFIDSGENKRVLGEWKGRPLLLNFWATWCPPCVKELPSLSRLRLQLKSEGIDVVAINVDKEHPAEVNKFLSGVDAGNLEPFRDPRRSLMKSARIASLPTTLLINAEGHEVAAVLQDAQWDDPDIAAFIATCLGHKKTPKQ